MNELITIGSSTIDGQAVNTVNARDLHVFLEVGKDFSTWMKAQVERARLMENRDYVKVTQKGELSRTGQIRIDYFLTLDAAKHVAMMSGTDKGFEVRDYFIECERRALAAPPQPFQIPASFAEALRLAADLEDKNNALIKQIELDRPKTIFADAVTVSHTTILVGELAKLLKQNGIEIGQNRLFERLRKDGWLMKRHGSDWNMPTQKSMELGLFEIKERTVNDANGAVRITKTVKVTGRGQVFFINLFIKERDGEPIPVPVEGKEVVGVPSDRAPIN